ncbi:MAG: malonyl-CoA decarboxylase [Burkholderiaceae bacterium]|nr:malonyl-CoA decarboxylase [Burkholderiaceae bacterium]
MPPDGSRLVSMSLGPGPQAGAGRFAGHPLTARELTRARRWMRCLVDPDLTDAEALPVAQRLAEVYLRLDPSGRLGYQQAMASEFDRQSAPAGLLSSSRMLLLRRFNLMPGGLRFLVDLRADVLEALAGDPTLAGLQADLETLLSAWFDVGLLEMRRLTWHSPASLLEKLVQYEAVHAIGSWSDLKNRLDEDRRCYAFFHPRLPDEPLIFVEVAFVRELTDNIETLLDERAPLEDLRRARIAVFYSISNTQRGLRGLAFGNFLLKRVIEALRTEGPRLKSYATLSPIPGLRGWLGRQGAETLAAILGPAQWQALQAAGGLAAFEQRTPSHEPLPLRAPLLRLAAHYLMQVDAQARPLDPVARFHLGNGARLERLNWAGDPSDKGWRQSYGLMVNYLYDPDRLDRNRAQLARGRPAVGSPVQALLAEAETPAPAALPAGNAAG